MQLEAHDDYDSKCIEHIFSGPMVPQSWTPMLAIPGSPSLLDYTFASTPCRSALNF